MKTRHSVNQLHEDYNSVFDTFEKGKSLFAEGLFFEGYSFIRESLNRSEIDDHDILRVLKGDASVIFTRQDFFDVVEHPSYSQLCAIQKIKDEYSQLIVVDNKHYKSIKTVSYDFFESISPRRFNKNTIYSVSLIKSFMFDVSGDYFIIIEDNLHFITTFEVKGFNPFFNS